MRRDLRDGRVTVSIDYVDGNNEMGWERFLVSGVRGVEGGFCLRQVLVYSGR